MTVWQQLDVPLEGHPKQAAILYLASRTNLHPILMHHLYVQGITSLGALETFLFPRLTGFHDPFLLNDMKNAVSRILKAIHNQEQILIFGDYDCDGITSSTLLCQALKKLGGNVTIRLPLRSEGYGLSSEIINQLSEGISLIITVDNGSSAHEAMKAAKLRGIDVIVTDHHEVLGEHPDCISFINPKRKDNTYPFPSLAGVGVALKVVQGLLKTLNRDWIGESIDYIELATLGTIADLMPLTGENRLICWFGLRKLNTSPSPVFRMLFDVLRLSFIDSTTIGFQIAPIFNACGRIADPNLGWKLLQNSQPTKKVIQQFIKLNEKRKELCKQQFQIATQRITQQELYKQNIIVVHDDFHHGIIGILAGKIAEQYKKPAIVISKEGTGSARTVNGTGFSIIKAIQSCGMHLKKYGGHQAAAGLSIEATEIQIDLFRKGINQSFQSQQMSQLTLSYIHEISIQDFPLSCFEELITMEPFGIGNTKPVFCCRKISPTSYRLLGSSKEHVQFQFSSRTAYAFFKGALFKNGNQDSKLHLLYSTYCYKKKDFFIQDFSITN